MPKRELTDREILELNRVDDGPDDIPQAKPYHHPGDKVPVNFAVKTITIEEPTPPVQDLGAVLLRLVDDGGFQVRAAERRAIQEALAKDKELLAEIEQTGEDLIRKQRKVERLESDYPLPDINQVVAQAKDHRRVLKDRRAALRVKLGPVVASMLERANTSASIAIDLMHENEKGRADDYGVEFRKSNTLLACIAARRLLEEPARIAIRAPDLVDLGWVCRLLGVTETSAVVDE